MTVCLTVSGCVRDVLKTLRVSYLDAISVVYHGYLYAKKLGVGGKAPEKNGALNAPLIHSNNNLLNRTTSVTQITRKKQKH